MKCNMLTISCMKWRRLIWLAFFVTFSQFAGAGETMFLALERLNGATEKIELSESVNIKLDADNFCVEHDGTALAIPLSEVKEYRFVSGNSNDIEVLPDSSIQDAVEIKVVQQVLYIKTSETSASLVVSNLDGVIILRQDIGAATWFAVDMSSWVAGVYVVMLNGSSHKIIKR